MTTAAPSQAQFQMPAPSSEPREALRRRFDEWTKRAPEFAPEFQQHRAWAEQFAWLAVLDLAAPAPQPAGAEPVAPLQAGMSNDELLAAWRTKLRRVEPSDRDLRAFAVGAEVGYALASSRSGEDAALAALAELVDLKRLIARVDETRLEGGLRVPVMNLAEADATREEYQRRKPAAWARAFEIVDAARGDSHGN